MGRDGAWQLAPELVTPSGGRRAGGLGYMQINRLGGRGGGWAGVGRGRPAQRLSSSSIDAHLCFSHSLLRFFFFSLSLSFFLRPPNPMITYLYLSLGEFAPLLMRPSLVNSYRASLVEIEGELITKYVVIIIIRETTTCGVVYMCRERGLD